MDAFKALEDLITRKEPAAPRDPAPADKRHGIDLSSLNEYIGPAAIGGIAGALLTGKGLNGLVKGALLAGGGAVLWDKYKDRLKDYYSKAAKPTVPTPIEAKSARMIRALVYAAKADGHVDAAEQKNITARIDEMGAGSLARQIARQAMDEPLDPQRVADGVSGPEEALQLFALSCAAADSENFMARTYLDALATALHIPADVRQEILEKAAEPA
ncbi:MAG: tellurite resistance TerB family protein [Planctomycetes bacterium]|nr:tellurite resistance TerB family protein [Planctomycetota bacterium]